ncbi:GNAT family N-acetyltransferase [Sporolactobacillus sp. CPB3-1]|uniref:GNAT family N-acetyltransferase n=1 Tax=Sporolactobacillus mangiferae TaxID=2940498 RepID=A0ABT0MDG3_9BACL|nr:GNAT family protein [Sporolactobacillus mangiferae]MCL1632912.1 GNAT family N-acetyltransferase [Sporolactobacillus mangiferae]
MDLFQEKQPDILSVSTNLRLTKFRTIIPEALGWYQDETMLRMISRASPLAYDEARLSRMYHYLEQHGELYYIEYANKDSFVPIGDVTLCPRDLPIVIGNPAFRGNGIGTQVIRSLAERAFTMGMHEVYVQEIYDENTASRKAFEHCGFRKDAQTSFGHAYRLNASEFH